MVEHWSPKLVTWVRFLRRVPVYLVLLMQIHECYGTKDPLCAAILQMQRSDLKDGPICKGNTMINAVLDFLATLWYTDNCGNDLAAHRKHTTLYEDLCM